MPPELLGAAQRVVGRGGRGRRDPRRPQLAGHGPGSDRVPRRRDLVADRARPACGSVRSATRSASSGSRSGSTCRPTKDRARATQFYVNGLEPVVDVTTARGYRHARHDEAPRQGRRRERCSGCGGASPTCGPATASRSRSTARRFAAGGGAPAAARGALDGRASRARAPRAMTPELAELVGYFMGDGSLHSRGIRLCVADGDFDVVERLELLGQGVLRPPRPTSHRGQGYSEVGIPLGAARPQWWEACGLREAPAVRRVTPARAGCPHIPEAVLAHERP